MQARAHRCGSSAAVQLMASLADKVPDTHLLPTQASQCVCSRLWRTRRSTQVDCPGCSSREESST